MYLRGVFLKKVVINLSVFFLFMFEIIGLIKVNIVNTKILSPIGNGDENYKLVYKELGEEFANFIRDDASIKIYEEDSKITMIRAFGKNYTLKYPL